MVPQLLGLLVILVPVEDPEVKDHLVQLIQLQTLDLKAGMVEQVPLVAHHQHHTVRLVSEGLVVLVVEDPVPKNLAVEEALMEVITM